MRVVEFSRSVARPIDDFDSAQAASVHLASGRGDAHVYVIHFGPDGVIGEHPTGFCQLFLVTAGIGWAAGADGNRVALLPGQGARFDRGELHSKGGADGTVAIMVQVDAFD